MIDNVLIVLLAYLIGAIPTGYLIGKIGYGVDLRTTGSGNVGATNAYRTLGAKAGLLVFFADFFKGMAAVYPGMPDPVLVLACAVFAIIGNDWSVFLEFKSGKGVACGVGAFTLICPYATLASFVVWLAVFRWKRIVSLASVISAPVVPIVIMIMRQPAEYQVFSVAAALIVIVKHKDNIGRLIRGEEKPITARKKG